MQIKTILELQWRIKTNHGNPKIRFQNLAKLENLRIALENQKIMDFFEFQMIVLKIMKTFEFFMINNKIRYDLYTLLF